MSHNREESNFSQKKNTIKDESKLLEKSLDNMGKLAKDVTKATASKEKLEESIDELKKKVKTMPEDTNSKTTNKLLLTIKKEIIADIKPLLAKMNFKSLKSDPFEEFTKILEIEIAKIKSEINSKNTKTKKDIVKEISEFEIRLIDTIKKHKDFKKELREKDNKIKELEKIVEKRIKSEVKEFSEKIKHNTKATKSALIKIDDKFSDLEKEIKKFEDLTHYENNRQDIDLSSYDSRIQISLFLFLNR
jgi:hypothetical protein